MNTAFKFVTVTPQNKNKFGGNTTLPAKSLGIDRTGMRFTQKKRGSHLKRVHDVPGLLGEDRPYSPPSKYKRNTTF